jgi:hypothetical protein
MTGRPFGVFNIPELGLWRWNSGVTAPKAVRPSDLVSLLDAHRQVGNEVRLEFLKRRSFWRRTVRRFLPWLALTAFLLLALASVARAQMTPNGRPLVLWEPPLVIGMYTIDSARVDDSLPVIATADWPAFTDTVAAELRSCTGLHGGLAGWQVRTVARGVFSVSTYNESEGWHANDAYIGFTFPHVKRIYVVQEGLRYRGLVKHELLHALLSDHGIDPRHGTPVADAMFARCVPEKPR